MPCVNGHFPSLLAVTTNEWTQDDGGEGVLPPSRTKVQMNELALDLDAIPPSA